MANAEKIRAAAERALRTVQSGRQVVMVVSAMADTTDKLEDLAEQVMKGKPAPKREMDQLLSTGEQVSISLVAMALEEMGQPAISFTASQIGMVTDNKHTKARIKSIAAEKIHEELDAGKVVIVAGFQGITETGAVTTLGRGGSNVTLVALAAALKADICENYTDVDGIYTADPRMVPNARKIDEVSYDEMLELASLGANVLHNRAVEFAKKYNVPIHVRSSLNDSKGTMIVAETKSMEQIVVSGTALKEELARISFLNVPDVPGTAARIFHTMATHGIVVDDIIQNSAEQTAMISFTCDLKELPEARKVCDTIAGELSCDVRYEDHLAKVSAVGVGMRVHTGVAEKMFESLANAEINIQNITTSEIKISCMVNQEEGTKALKAVHDAFELGEESQQTET